jgi:hypothetical protein
MTLRVVFQQTAMKVVQVEALPVYPKIIKGARL